MSMNLNDDNFIRRNDSYGVRKIGDNSVLFLKNEYEDYENEEFFILNEMSFFIWENLNKNINFRDLVNLVLDCYDANKEKVELDLKKYIGLLFEKGLVELI